MKKRIGAFVLGLLACALISSIAWTVAGQRKDKEPDADAQWEYLVVAGGASNLSTAGNDQYPNLRKQPDTSFAREFFPLERNFDKLGAKGWELVTVTGPANDPVYFFKRPKTEHK